MSSRLPAFLLAGALMLSQPLLACLWDTDTLSVERKRFPGIAQIITGNFGRHSREFHEWRVRQRSKDVASNDSFPGHYQDLAVSQHKLGDHRAAIETMLKLEKQMPGLYETYSNLGTFHIYTGELDEALKYINKALKINPDAHFGREKYQAWLIEWILERKAVGTEEPTPSDSSERSPIGFARFVTLKAIRLPKEMGKVSMPEGERQAAIRGVTGMMIFADYDNPALLEALGDLLQTGKIGTNAKQLAGLCYLHAALKVKAEAEKQRLLKLCEYSNTLTMSFDIQEAEKLLKSALEKGAAYVDSIRQDEMRWIAEGKDAAREYQEKYLQAK